MMPVARYWCHACSRMVNPVMDAAAEIKCPNCGEGFLEEIEVREAAAADPDEDDSSRLDPALLTSILFNFVRSSGNRRRPTDDPYPEDISAALLSHHVRGRRSNHASMLELIHGLRVVASTSAAAAAADDNDRARVMLHREGGGISLGDYYVGSGIEALLNQLTENDPNRHGTPPALKEAVASLPTVRSKKAIGCPVCLEELETGGKGKEMPCGHVFHSDCLLPWLELHSSCPVCRFQLPVEGEEFKGPSSSSSAAAENPQGRSEQVEDSGGRRAVDGEGSGGRGTVNGGGSGRRGTVDGEGSGGRRAVDGEGSGGRRAVDGEGNGGRGTVNGAGSGGRGTVDGEGSGGRRAVDGEGNGGRGTVDGVGNGGRRAAFTWPWPLSALFSSDGNGRGTGSGGSSGRRNE